MEGIDYLLSDTKDRSFSCATEPKTRFWYAKDYPYNIDRLMWSNAKWKDGKFIIAEKDLDSLYEKYKEHQTFLKCEINPLDYYLTVPELYVPNE